MTTQEIADYLEKNGYPAGPSLTIKTKSMIMATGIKGAYFFQAALLSYVYNEQEITKEFLDDLIQKRNDTT